MSNFFSIFTINSQGLYAALLIYRLDITHPSLSLHGVIFCEKHLIAANCGHRLSTYESLIAALYFETGFKKPGRVTVELWM